MRVVVGASLLGLALAVPAAPGLSLVLRSDDAVTTISDVGTSETQPESAPAEPVEPESAPAEPAEPESAPAEPVEPEAEPAEPEVDDQTNDRAEEMTALGREHADGMRAWRACVRAFKSTRGKGEHPHGTCVKPTPPGHLKNGTLWRGGTAPKHASKNQPASSSQDKPPKVKPEKPAKLEKPAKPEKPAKLEKPAKPAKPENPAKPEKR